MVEVQVQQVLEFHACSAVNEVGGTCISVDATLGTYFPLRRLNLDGLSTRKTGGFSFSLKAQDLGMMELQKRFELLRYPLRSTQDLRRIAKYSSSRTVVLVA